MHWEYKVVEQARGDDLESVLNSLGAERWELVAALGKGDKFTLILKRRK